MHARIASRAARLLAAFTLVAALLAPAPASAQEEVVGRWEGTITVPQGSLRIVFEIAAGEDGLTTTMYSPDQVPQPIPTGATTFEEGKLLIEVPIAQARYEGTMNDEGIIEGTWFQGPASLPLNLEKAET